MKTFLFFCWRATKFFSGEKGQSQTFIFFYSVRLSDHWFHPRLGLLAEGHILRVAGNVFSVLSVVYNFILWHHIFQVTNGRFSKNKINSTTTYC